MEAMDEDEEIEETVYFDQSVDEVNNFIVVSTLQDGNFVVEALFSAVEEGNIAGLEELFTISHIDPNYCNKHGETAVHIAAGLGHLNVVKFLHSKKANIRALDSHGDSAIYWAARQGHEQVIRYLYEEGVSVDIQNKAKETALHVASRYGHTNAVALLCRCCTDVNLPDEHGETALHIGVWHGFPKIVDTLCNFGAKTNLRNKEEETPLHCAAARGHTDCVRSLLDAGVDLNLVDKCENTALHLAMRRHHESVASLLLQAGCKMDVFDNQGEGPIHIACRDGLLPLVKTLCSSGCKVNVPNKMGFYPIHLAAKNGRIEIVRILCLAGCIVDQKNREGIPAEISALAQGYNDIADILNRLKNEQQREEYINQLTASVQPISRMQLKVLGHSGVGKTSLLDSLKCGYFSSWFRRSKSNSSSSVGSGCVKMKNGTHSSKSSIESDYCTSEDPCLSFETNFDSYTHGIDIHQVNISGVGDLSLWEFSGHEPYYLVYDRFLGNCHCLHAIVFSLNESFDVQLQQVIFWLSFLQSRMPPQEPLGLCGKSRHSAKVVLVATHADAANCQRNNLTSEYVSTEADAILEAALLRFKHIFDIHDTAYVMDAHVVGSQAMKSLKQHITNCKNAIAQELPKQTGFLEAMLIHLQRWRQSSTHFPVMSHQQFCDLVHSQVNPLATTEHIKVMVEQLQLMGELLFLRLETQDLIVLNPRWLCVDIIGQMLSQEHLETAKITGTYTMDDIQLLFPDTDALDLLQVLESLQLCTQCDSNGDIEYEFPCFNMLDSQDYLWEKGDLRYTNAVYGGVRLQSWPADKHLLRCVIPRLQVQLRRYSQNHVSTECVLQQWRQGSNFTCNSIQGQITLGEFGESIDVKVRAPSFMRVESFYFLSSLLGIIDSTLVDMCPGLLCERHAISPTQLCQHEIQPISHPSHSLLNGLLEQGLTGTVRTPDGSVEEQLADVICLGSTDIIGSNHNNNTGGVVLGPQLHASNLPIPVHQRLCSLLDPPEAIGRDWCMLAVLLGLTDMLPHLDPGENPAESPTSRIVREWLKEPSSTVSCLLDKLKELGRNDAVEVIMRTAPFIKVFPVSGEVSSDDISMLCSMSHTSSSNISR
ncbi:death-associated protein kinase dapk-1 [Caerostris darwini]|uniref:Death-associated protein kinase dapk-1 n=1 Tax=Caerostris darwini TaxID=1538125 RepID=A0AAV4REB6_9ARAC|nr:death-associated protein kinase dapk-1 [Caerostris darwini]